MKHFELLPELELGEATNKGLELIRALGGQQRAIGGIGLGIDQRGEKTDEEVEDVDPEGVRDNVKAVDGVDADREEEGEN